MVAVERGIEIWSISGDKEKGRRVIFYQIILYHVNYKFSLIVTLKYCCLKFLHHLTVLRWKLERDSAWFYSILYSGSENRKLQESKALLYFSWELLDININLQILVVDALWGSKNCCIQCAMNGNTGHNSNRTVPVKDLQISSCLPLTII